MGASVNDQNAGDHFTVYDEIARSDALQVGRRQIGAVDVTELNDGGNS
jgi:hypothetical protein